MVDFVLGLRVFLDKGFSVKWKLACNWVCDSGFEIVNFSMKDFLEGKIAVCKIEIQDWIWEKDF